MRVNRKFKKVKEEDEKYEYSPYLERVFCLFDGLPILDALRATKKFCDGKCRKAYWLLQQKKDFGHEHEILRWAKETSKILSKIYAAGTRRTSLKMLAMVGVKLECAFLPYKVIDDKDVYKFGPMYLTLLGGDDAIISKSLDEQ